MHVVQIDNASNKCSFEMIYCIEFIVNFVDKASLLNSIILKYTVSKNCAKLFLSELSQISNNFDNFWQKDGKEAKIMRGGLTYHLTKFASPNYHVKRRCSKLLRYTMLKVVICNKLSNDLISTQ